MLLVVLAMLLMACASSPPPSGQAPASGAAGVNPPASTAEVIRQAWSFDDPRASEQRFRDLSAAALARGEVTAALELETQVARAQGLDGRFAEASSTLAGVEAKLGAQPGAVRVRWLLERGRVLNSSDQPEPARPLFEQALELARAEQLDALAVDAAHMVAITFLKQPDQAIAWNDRALALARASQQADARRWLGSLLNNQGWSYYEKQDYARALELFEEALELRRGQSDARATRIAKWCVGKALRAVGQLQRALELQQELLAENTSSGEHDGFVFEELGECYQALGDAVRARENFSRAYAELSKDADFARHEAARLERLGRLGGAL